MFASLSPALFDFYASLLNIVWFCIGDERTFNMITRHFSVSRELRTQRAGEYMMCVIYNATHSDARAGPTHVD